MQPQEPDLAAMIGRARFIERARRRPGYIEQLKGWLFVTIGVIYAAVFILMVIIGWLVVSTARAEASKLTPVPLDCVELAQREGFPTDYLTRLQVVRARVRMARLSKTDPLVEKCRAAIKAYRDAQQ